MNALRWVVIVVLAIAASARAQDSDSWRRANDEFAAGRFAEAVELYQSIARGGETSAALFYNLANAHYRAGQLGEAILNYERALALDPRHPEAIANLRLVRDKARALELKRSAVDRLVGRGTPTQYSVAAAIGFWAFAFALAALLLARRRSSSLVALAIVGFLMLSLSVAALYSREQGPNGQSVAIVTAGSIEARLATAESAGTVLALPAGSEIKILSTRGGWSYAELPNDLRGWIPANSAERVRL